MMLRQAGMILAIVSAVALAGCSSKPSNQTDTPGPTNFEVIRRADIGSKWHMQQVEVDLKANAQLPILLKLTEGDTVDGYFYLEKGTDVGFHIDGNSQFYASSPAAGSKGIASDRFSFAASKAQGNTYTLTLEGNKQSDVTVFLEIVYPAADSVFTPMK